MKREFPALYAAASIWIATPLLGFWTVFYVQQAATQGANKVYPAGMAAFGVTAALSAICFSMAPVCDNPPTPQYAGEKFLHSSLLLVQTLLVLYVRDAAAANHWAQTHSFIVAIIRSVAGGVVSLIAIAAAWTWYHGFSELNSMLWKNWERRIQKLNDAAQRSKSPDELDKKPKGSSTEISEPSFENTSTNASDVPKPARLAHPELSGSVGTPVTVPGSGKIPSKERRQPHDHLESHYDDKR